MRAWGIWWSPPAGIDEMGMWSTDTSGLIISTYNRDVALAILRRVPGPNRTVREFGPMGLPVPVEQEKPWESPA